MPKKKRQQKQSLHPSRILPPLSLQSAAEFYQLEEEAGVYDGAWQNLGYILDHGGDLPVFDVPQQSVNNRAPGWNGIFAFTFVWRQADPTTQANILRSLEREYGCELSNDKLSGHWLAQIRTTGKRVKSLTRLLNRQYARGYLVWKEL